MSSSILTAATSLHTLLFLDSTRKDLQELLGSLRDFRSNLTPNRISNYERHSTTHMILSQTYQVSGITPFSSRRHLCQSLLRSIFAEDVLTQTIDIKRRESEDAIKLSFASRDQKQSWEASVKGREPLGAPGKWDGKCQQRPVELLL